MAFFSYQWNHPCATALSLFLPFAFGLFLPWRRFICLRSLYGARLVDSSFRLFPWGSRCYTFGPNERLTRFRAGLRCSNTFSRRSFVVLWRRVRSSRPAGTRNATPGEFAWLRCSSNVWTAAVYSCTLLGVGTGGLHLVLLCIGERGMSLTGRGPLFETGSNRGAAWAAVETGAGGAHVTDIPAVNGRDVRYVDVIYLAVVIEPAAAPIAAIVTETGIAIAIVNTAVKAYRRPPVAFVPDIHAVVPCPIAWRP